MDETRDTDDPVSAVVRALDLYRDRFQSYVDAKITGEREAIFQGLLADMKEDHPDIAEKAAFFGELKGYATVRGHKPKWADHKYRERFGVWPNDPRIRGAASTPPSLKTKNWLTSRTIAFHKARERA
jgi:hypothetical protein